MTIYYVSSFSGNDSNSGLSPADPFENGAAAFVAGASGDDVLFSNAQVHIPNWGALWPGFLQIGAYAEAGGSDFTLQSPLEAALGIPPRVAARFDGTSVNSSVDIGYASYKNISFWNINPGSSSGTFINNSSYQVRVFDGCEFASLGGKALMFLDGYNIFKNVWVHETQGSSSLFNTFGELSGGLIEIDSNPIAGNLTIFPLYVGGTVENTVLRINTGLSNGNVIRAVEFTSGGSEIGVTLRNNIIHNLRGEDVYAFDFSFSSNMIRDVIADNIFLQLNQPNNASITGVSGLGEPSIMGSNSYYDSDNPDAPPIGTKMDITDADYLAAGDPFVNSSSYDYRLLPGEKINNISSINNHSLRGAIQDSMSSGGGGKKLFLLNCY